MKRQIRHSVFETNSSSVHSITICSEEEFKRFKNGELAINDANQFKPVKDLVHNPDYDEEETGYMIDPSDSGWENEYRTYDAYMDNYYMESYEERYTTEHGDKIVAFGYYGHD